MATRLITIPFSHFCEKARWALDRAGVSYTEDGHLPLFHYLPARRAGGGRTVPVLVDGSTVIADSTDIVAWADARSPGTFLPTDPVERAAALQLEDDLDLDLGPDTRRWTYFHLLHRRDLDPVILRGIPRWERLALTATRPLATGFLERKLKINAASVERSCRKIDDAFERIAALISDGRRFLVGDRFSVADLTFAALAAPVLLPPTYGVALPAPTDFPAEPRAQLDAWRATPAGQFALHLYATERTPTRRAA